MKKNFDQMIRQATHQKGTWAKGEYLIPIKCAFLISIIAILNLGFSNLNMEISGGAYWGVTSGRYIRKVWKIYCIQ